MITTTKTASKIFLASLGFVLLSPMLKAAETQQELARKLWPEQRIQAALETIFQLKAAGMMSEDHYRRKKAMLDARLAGRFQPTMLATSNPPLNFIQNAGFEEINRNSRPDRSRWLWWSGWSWGGDYENRWEDRLEYVHSGKYSARIRCLGEKGRIGIMTPKLPVVLGATEYEFSIWAKGEGDNQLFINFESGARGAFVEEYRKAGYTKPIMFAAPMSLSLSGLTGYGPIDSKRFQRKYIDVMRKLHAEMQKHDIPAIFSIGDEFTNKGIKGVEYAGKLARFVFEELPEICVTSDMNGYMEAMAMSPYLNYANFNNGWDGIDNHNQGRRLANDGFIKQLADQTGAIPYFVNTGKGRFPFGFFFWKMSKYGVAGKVEWFYNLDGAGGGRGSVVKLDGARITHTVDYELSREGVDDLKYLCKLENLIAVARKAGAGSREADASSAFLKSVEESIIPNWTAYSQGGMRWPADGMEPLDLEKAAAIGSLNALRRGVADHIIAIQNALR